MLNSNDIDCEKLIVVSEKIRVLAHPVRIEILETLLMNKQLNVFQICDKLNLEQPTVSNHLILMKSKGFVESTRSGKNVFYRARKEQIEMLSLAIRTLVKNN